MAGIQSCCSCMQSPLTALTQNTIMWSMGPCRFRLLPPQGCFPVAISIYSLYKSSSFFSILLFLLPRIFTPEPHPSFWPAAAYLFSKSHFSHSHCVWHLSQPLFLMRWGTCGSACQGPAFESLPGYLGFSFMGSMTVRRSLNCTVPQFPYF